MEQQINEIVTTNLLTPQADFKVYNATLSVLERRTPM
jgi:hypothetical protein